jgi:hypothetical protein
VNRGSNFFLGGTASGLISQRIDIAALSQDVDEGIVDYAMRGWFGGAEGEDDRMALTARFLDGTGAALGSNTVGNVTAADRGGVTGLWDRAVVGGMPAGTRFVEFLLASQAVTGNNDGSADNLTFVLSAQSEPPFSISLPTISPEGWRIEVPATRTNRLYILERSSDLVQWEPATSAIPGVGSVLTLVDSNAPSMAVYYRVQCRRP